MDKRTFLVLPILILVLILQGSFGDSDTNSTVIELSQNWSYCFEFTWFGPNYDNYTIYNGTCSDYKDDYRATNIPCSDPLVITYDGSAPDIDYLWEHHRNSVVCRMSNTQKCVKYSYIFNGQVLNTTYMCAQVGGAALDGCATQKMGGYQVEACVCESGKGIYKPCNSAILGNRVMFSLILLPIFIAVILI